MTWLWITLFCLASVLFMVGFVYVFEYEKPHRVRDSDP